MEREFRKRKRDMIFRRRDDGLSAPSAMNVDDGLRLVVELLELVDAPRLPPEANREALLYASTSLRESYEEATFVRPPLTPTYDEDRGRGLSAFDDEPRRRELRLEEGEATEPLAELDSPPLFTLDDGVFVFVFVFPAQAAPSYGVCG